MIVYPSELPANGIAFNFISDKAYNPQNDILLSIEYAISGHATTEAGLAFFVARDSSLNGGTPGADLCYSGSLSGASSTGISVAEAGIGIDSTGVFGLSAGRTTYPLSSAPLSSSSVVDVWRDGYMDTDLIPNSVAARAGSANAFALSTFSNYYRAISSFNVVEDHNRPRYLRFRLGDVARTMYLDYKANMSEQYESIAAVDIGDLLNVTATSETFYKVGMGFTSPVNSSLSSTVASFCFKTVHLEGLVTSLSSIAPLIEVWENVLPLWPDVGESWSL